MEEEQPRFQLIEFPLSGVAEEMALSFLAPARTQGKELEVRIQPTLAFTGDKKAIRQLLSLLLDNALKYSSSGGTIGLKLDIAKSIVVAHKGRIRAESADGNSLTIPVTLPA